MGVAPPGPHRRLDADARGRLAGLLRHRFAEFGVAPVIDEWRRSLEPMLTAREAVRLRQLVESIESLEADPSVPRGPGELARIVRTLAVEDPGGDGVVVMNIHQSKGLEFRGLVVTDLGGKLCHQPDIASGTPSKPTLPVPEVSSWYSEKGRPSEVEQVHQETTDRAALESVCGLYVALTRAARDLVVQVPSPSINQDGEESQDQSWFRRRHHSRSLARSRGRVMTMIQPRWPRSQVWKARSSTPEVEECATACVARPRRTPDHRDHGSTASPPGGFHEAAFRSEGGSTAVSSSCETPVPWTGAPPFTPALKRSNGRRILNDLAMPIWMLGFAAWSPAVHGMADGVHHGVSGGVSAPGDLRTPLGTEPGQVVRRERRFVVSGPEGFQQGSIDRLVLRNGDRIGGARVGGGSRRVVGARIIDFKTDRLDSDLAAPSEVLLERHRLQLEGYRAAIARSYGLDASAITAAIVAVDAGLVVDLPATVRAEYPPGVPGGFDAPVAGPWAGAPDPGASIRR